ncbi:cilia- and flagella-associated protein 263 isoform X2 [Salvelinus sp. IW2-2015]|uniref:cilia- and flagella-associated protein 263 isoform X2 n=1 Tax=Salvelinus sp. IW2-2015 TaxID=2691554 RepID=UPI000CDFB3A8|nr:coiled-coil domain-containing protein 113 isoform X2 [Salvelinus alpinus]
MAGLRRRSNRLPTSLFTLATMAETVQDVSEADKQHLVELVKELRRSNAVLRAETDMYERYISRLDPRDLVPQPLSDSLGAAAASQLEIGGGRGRKMKKRTTALEQLQRLTLEQKCDVAQRELDETKEDLEKLKESSERVLHNYKATLEEADIRLVEVKKASYEFDRDVAKVLREKRGVMMGAEKVIRYFEDRMRAKDTLVEKLRLKNAALHVQKRKLQLQLRQKEEMGEALHEVDFQQLKIENSQYLERIDERNQDLLRLKLLAGNTLQVLNSYKERAKAETLNRKLRGQLADFRVPHVLQYITAKASHSQLEQSVRAWERKVEISEMALKTHTKTWNKLKEAAGVGPVTAR